MRHSIRTLALRSVLGLLLIAMLPRSRGDEPNDSSLETADRPALKNDPEGPAVNLLDAIRDRRVSVKAEGIGDGRMKMSVTNRTKRPLRVVLPPGIIAQGATGQFGGMGGMGGGMGMMGGMGGGMGGGMSGGMMGGMGGGMGGGMSGGMGGGMGQQSGTMPSMMGLMSLSRMIMYFCGDPESWDMRSLMIGMMGGGGMGGMMGGGGMGGGMMGGGGMGGGMRSVSPTDLPSALLKSGQTRHLPTRLVSVSPPDPEQGLVMPEKGEQLRIAGDIAEINDTPAVAKALRRLAADKAPASVAQLVMWRVAAGLDWETIADRSRNWSNAYELALAQDFIERLDALGEGETGRLRIELSGSDKAGRLMAAEAAELLQGKMMLGLLTEIGVPERPDGPAVACRVQLTAGDARVRVLSTDATGRTWTAFGKFSVPVVLEAGRFATGRFADALAEGILNRLVRAQVAKGPRAKGKPTYQIRIDNASPLILNGLAAVGVKSEEDKAPKILSGICIAPCRSLTVPASDEVVRMLGLKNGIRLVALDLSGL